MITTKEYESYEAYVAHQKSKADHGTALHKRLLTDLWEPDCDGFRLNFKPYRKILNECNNALCLGARTGQEVFVLREMGVEEAIGIDLVANPPLVFEGDVHQLSYADESYDFVFSNIFDHVLYPEKFISEIKRVLKHNSHCLLHLSIATDGHDHPDDDQWAANSISSSAAVIEMLGEGYEIIEDKPLNQPNWPTYWTLFFKKK